MSFTCSCFNVKQQRSSIVWQILILGSWTGGTAPIVNWFETLNHRHSQPCAKFVKYIYRLPTHSPITPCYINKVPVGLSQQFSLLNQFVIYTFWFKSERKMRGSNFFWATGKWFVDLTTLCEHFAEELVKTWPASKSLFKTLLSLIYIYIFSALLKDLTRLIPKLTSLSPKPHSTNSPKNAVMFFLLKFSWQVSFGPPNKLLLLQQVRT